VSAGDLGVTAASVDEALTVIFRISSMWKALVLIDEADVFLEERSLQDLERNAMVAVFLRQLEYFSGIIFLTTNRVRVFDQAFQSRIHVSLKYPDLTLDARRQIWSAFLNKVKLDDLTDHQTNGLCQRDMSGRKIKNIVKIASALAIGRDVNINYSILMEAMDLMTQFDDPSYRYFMWRPTLVIWQRLSLIVQNAISSSITYLLPISIFILFALALTPNNHL